MVLLYHGTSLVDSPLPFMRYYVSVSQWGWAGVDLFFVLSAYLLTGILLNTKGSEGYFRNFYARRVLRIFPAYYLTLAAIFLAVYLERDPAKIALLRPHQTALLFFFANDTMGHYGIAPLSIHLWSICVEEQFYLIWPAIVFFLPARRLAAFCAAALPGACLIRFILVHSGLYSCLASHWALETRFDAFAMGALLALAHFEQSPSWVKRIFKAEWLMTLGLALVIAATLIAGRPAADSEVVQVAGLSGFTLFFGGLLASALRLDSRAWGGRLLLTQPLPSIGKYSYGLYLYHILVMRLIQKFEYWHDVRSGWHLALLFSLYLMGTVVTALLSYHLFEKRFLELKRYFALPSSGTGGEALAPRVAA